MPSETPDPPTSNPETPSPFWPPHSGGDSGEPGSLQFVFLNGDLKGDASSLTCNAVTQGGTFYADSCPPEVP